MAEVISNGKSVSGLGNEVTDLSGRQIIEDLQASMRSLVGHILSAVGIHQSTKVISVVYNKL